MASWQEVEISRLKTRLEELEKENEQLKANKDLYHRLMLESNEDRCYFQKSFYILRVASRSVIAMSEAAQELEDYCRAKYTLLDAAGNLMDLALKATEFRSSVENEEKVDSE